LASAPTRETVIADIDRHVQAVKESIKLIKTTQKKQGINVLHLCGGIGTAAQALMNTGINIANHIDVEIDPISRRIAAKNHEIDHDTLPQDLTMITEKDIDNLVQKYGKIHILTSGTPCQGLSRANRSGLGLADKRSALWHHAVRVLRLLQKHNPEVAYMFENVDFRDTHPADYKTTVGDLGIPEWTDASSMSASNRKRLFWHNLGPPGPRTTTPIDANTLLDEGGTLPGGSKTAPCLMANWNCSKNKCRRSEEKCLHPEEHKEWHTMTTHNPVLVTQGDSTRQVRVQEAERIMGFPTDYTRATEQTGSVIPDIERLSRLGSAMDVIQIEHILERWKATARPRGPEHTEVEIGPINKNVHEHVVPHTEWATKEIAK
jgi:site-specific DNA-cytosine methylase